MQASSLLSGRLFRRGSAVTVTAAGQVRTGRGVLATAGRTNDGFGALSHPLGELARPLTHFYGWLSGDTTTVGGTLTAHGKTYRILDEADILCAGCPLGTRLTLERREPDECR